ncbi:MAG: hypothetical protein GKR89_03485 [Candidatus Latescibacteria bacterium]|nr:hypothetical protein [Candidatus Latescibacterota bacterium]
MIGSSNPELQKNIWLELNPRRLAVMPLLLGGIFLAVALASDSTGEFAQRAWKYALWLYGFLVLLWGTKLASEGIAGEVNQRTWDNQRLTLISPWQLALGKLLGSTLYAWYGGLLCLLVFCLTYTDFANRGKGFKVVLTMVMIGLFAHALALLLSLVGLDKNRHRGRLPSTFYFLAGVVGALVMLNASLQTINEWGQTFQWYFASVALDDFTTLSAVFFCFWALLGLYRGMRGEMQRHNGPWAWWGFAASLALYAAGFAALGNVSPADHTVLGCYMALGVVTALTYYTAFSEVKDLVLIKSLGDCIAHRQWGPFFARAPLWLLTLVLTALCTLAALGASLVASDGSVMDQVQTTLYPFNVFCFLLRDLSLLFYLNLAANNRRADLATLIYLLALYGLLPTMLAVSSANDLLPALLPWPTDNPLIGTLLPLLQFVVVFYLLQNRLRQRLQAPINPIDTAPA